MTPEQVLQIAAQGVAAATPYLLAALGETFGQRAGVFNLGVDGVMLMGAFGGFYVALQTGSPLLGVAVAMLIGALMGIIMAVSSVTLKAPQGISGIGLYMFGLGLSTLLFETLVKSPVPLRTGFDRLPLPILSDLPILGNVAFNQNVMVYAAFLLVPIAWVVLNKTVFGLNIRAVGQNPQAADSLGINVDRVRYLALIIGGVLGGAAGASLSLAQTKIFQENMTNGIGFIAVALVYFGGWSPMGVMFGALLFSIVTTLQLWLQALGAQISPSLITMLPSVMTIIALIIAVRLYRTGTPAALGKPYRRDEA
jgi:simple sugar transport system permease protein